MAEGDGPALGTLLERDPTTFGRHLLALPAGAGADAVDGLATSRFPGARWEQAPSSSGAGVLRLSRHTTLEGPYLVSRTDAAGLGLPTATATVWDVRGPRERGEAPAPGGGDRDGLKRVFAAGAPVRDEERVVTWLVAAARRLGGAVRVGDPVTVLTPDPLALVARTVYAGVWLEPEAARVVVRGHMRSARLATEVHEWRGPAEPIDLAELGIEALGEHERAELHADAQEWDASTVSRPTVLDGYGVVGELGYDGEVWVEAAGEEVLPPVVSAQDWASEGVVSYRVSWVPPDEFEPEVESEQPQLEFRVARRRAVLVVEAVAASLAASTGGLVLDDDGFTH